MLRIKCVLAPSLHIESLLSRCLYNMDMDNSQNNLSLYIIIELR